MRRPTQSGDDTQCVAGTRKAKRQTSSVADNDATEPCPGPEAGCVPECLAADLSATGWELAWAEAGAVAGCAGPSTAVAKSPKPSSSKSWLLSAASGAEPPAGSSPTGQSASCRGINGKNSVLTSASCCMHSLTGRMMTSVPVATLPSESRTAQAEGCTGCKGQMAEGDGALWTRRWVMS